MARSVKELLDGNVPYKDMTEEEIDAVVQYKVSAANESKEAQEYRDMLLKAGDDIVSSNAAINERLASNTEKSISLLIGKSLKLRSY